MNDGLYDDMEGKFKFNIEYNCVESQLNTYIIDLRTVGDQYYGHVAEVLLFPDEDLLIGKWGGVKLNKDEITSMSQVIMLTESTSAKNTPLGEYIYIYIYILYNSRFTHNKKFICTC